MAKFSLEEWHQHPFHPIGDGNATVLILGTFPSVASRETQFYYGHPQNRFWRVLAAVFSDSVPQSIPQKCTFLEKHQIALWDVIQSCSISGSSDNSIRTVVPNDLTALLSLCPIQQIYANGQTAARLYRRYLQPQTHRNIETLPSTSPANAACSLEKLIEAWQVIRD